METVLKTTDYSLCKLMKGNRPLDEVHLRELMESMQEEQLVSFVVVNGNDEIIDGQHRWEACKRLGLPYYRFKNEETINYGLKQVQRSNTIGRLWNKKTYLSSYGKLGLKPYLQLMEFMKNYPDFGIMTAITIITNKCNHYSHGVRVKQGKLRYKKTKPFEEGQLEINDLALAYENASKIMEYKRFYNGYNRRSFVQLLIELFKSKKFNHDLMIRKLELNPTALVHCSTKEQYRRLLEDIYNYRNREKISFKYLT